MNPIFLSSILGTKLALRRRCPRCKREQVVPIGKRLKTVKCKFCGARIPLRK